MTLQSTNQVIKTQVVTSRRVSDAGSVALVNLDRASERVSITDPITTMIKLLTGDRNELTSQYAVRGGNYDENLVYVNDFEINRPFLVRSGQQEGLSFVNSDLVSGVNFSLGGFNAKYGDKMSSVLDVTYRRPTRFAGTATASLLGANLSLEGASKDTAFTWLVGLRQKSNQYLLQAQPTKGVYNPTFTDIQVLLNYHINKRWEIEGIGNYARNRFSFIPEESTTSFGLVQQAFQLQVFYDGSEIDQFDSRFAGLSTTYKSDNKKLRLKFLASGFQTDEEEAYDISGEYLLGELETDLGKTNFGQIKTYLGTGVIHRFARNYLKVNVGTLAHRGSYDAGKHTIQWGLDAMHYDINDKLHEWERRDSAGFTQPYQPNNLELTRFYNTSTSFNYGRYDAFAQDVFRASDTSKLSLTVGLRYTYNALNGESIFSPRAQALFRPQRGKNDLVIKAAAGIYAQPAIYREMRDLQGNVNKDLLAQKSAHFLLGTEETFKWGGHNMRWTSEVYYKQLWDLVPYEYDDVRIRYFGKNDAVGYAYGGEVRLYADLLKDATSWVSLGLLKTEENLNDDQIVYKGVSGTDSAIVHPGYIPRPSDQRFMFGLYLQDYLPRHPNFRVHLNLLYASGLPFGPPDGERYADTLRIPAYKRVDIGFSSLLLDGARGDRPSHSFFRNVGSIWGSLEVFNLLGIQNTLSYTYIQDQSSGRQYAVPNRLTSRLLNVKIIVKF